MAETRLKEHQLPLNYSAKAALGINNIGDICGKLVAKTITEAQKIVTVNSLIFFS